MKINRCDPFFDAQHIITAYMDTYIIDCGGWKGDSVKILRKRFDPEGKSLIHTFEVNPIFARFYKDFKNHTLHQKAVWVYDGEIDLYLQEDDPTWNKDGLGQGHSVLPQKSNIDTKKAVKVPCVDFSKWIMDNFSKDDHIILKMDIEGAEYKVLNKLLNDGSIDYIDELYVEFHHKKHPEIVTEEEHNKLLARLKLPVYEWKKECT